MSRLGQLSELIGTILLASSLAGRERIERWEAYIKRRLDIREVALRFTRQYQSTFKTIFNVLVLPITYIFLAIFFVNAITPEGLPTSIYILAHSEEYHASMFWVALFTVVVSPIVIIVLIIVAIAWFDVIEEMAEKTGRVVTHAIGLFICSVLLIPAVLSYILVYILLSPYLLAELISIRFGLRPVLGVLGTLVVILGLSLQLFA